MGNATRAYAAAFSDDASTLFVYVQSFRVERDGSERNDAAVLAYETDTGKERWRAVLHDVGQHYARGARVWPTSGRVLAVADGIVVAVSDSTGQLLWKRLDDDRLGGRQSTMAEGLLLQDFDNGVRAVRADDGDIRWANDAHDRMIDARTESGVVIALGRDGTFGTRLVGLVPSNGSVLWEFRHIDSTFDRWAFGDTDGAVFLPTNGWYAGPRLVALEALNGSARWEKGGTDYLQGLTGAGDQVILVQDHENLAGSDLIGLDSRTGLERWTTAWKGPAERMVLRDLVAGTNQVFARTYAPEENRSWIVAFASPTGEHHWNYFLPNLDPAALAHGEAVAALVPAPGRLALLLEPGQPVARIEVIAT